MNRIEDQGVGSDGFAAIDGVVAEEEDVSLAKMGVDDDGVVRRLRMACRRQTGEQHGFWRRRSAEMTSGRYCDGDHAWIIAGLFFVEWLSPPMAGV